MAQAKKRGLGRGLDALLRIDSTPEKIAENQGNLRVLAHASIEPGRWQPRRHIEPEALRELADSIRAQGLIQPIVVRELGRNRFEIVAGERRWRASALAELRDVPALVIDVSDQAAMAMALIENIQRQDLSALEEALALKRLIDEFRLTHQQVAEAVGRSRTAVSNLLRLLDMPDAVRALLEAGELEMGHARALLTLPAAQASRLAAEAAAGQWSVRQLEERVRGSKDRVAAKKGKGAGGKGNVTRDVDVARLETELCETLGARVRIESKTGGRGKLSIEYFSLDELDGILARLRG